MLAMKTMSFLAFTEILVKT